MVGAGFVAREHVQLLARVPDAVLTAIYDIDSQRAASLARHAGAASVGSIEEVVAGCDAVYVCTWTSEHHAVVEAVVGAGRALFCEKPLGPDIDEARTVAATVLRSGVINQAGLVLRYSPAFFWLEHLVGDPRSGRLLSVSFRSDQLIPLGGGYASTWRADPARAGSGVLLEHSIHDIDMLERLGGRVDSLSARSRSVHGIDGIEDVVVASLGFKSGAVGSLTTVWHDVGERLEDRSVEIFCERLWCRLDGSYHLGPVSWQRPGEPRESLGGEQLRRAALAAGLDTDNEDQAFVASVLDGKPANPDVAAALRAHQVVDAAYRSARQAGQALAVED